jgi:hypothetical protein
MTTLPSFRGYVLAFFEKLQPCLVGIAACASSHHWSRELQALGHTVLSEVGPVSLPQRAYQRIAVLAADLAVFVTASAQRALEDSGKEAI